MSGQLRPTGVRDDSATLDCFRWRELLTPTCE
jgi:hypothetical protein